MEKKKNKKDTRAFPIKKGSLAKMNPNDFMGILEHIDDKLSVLIEGQEMLVSRADRTDERMDALEHTVKSGFQMVMEYFSRLEDELKDIRKELTEIKKGKAEQKEVLVLETRVSKLELELVSLRNELRLQKH